MDCQLVTRRPLRIAVVSALQAGNQKAHAINVVKMAQGFHKCGCEVGLFTRASENRMPIKTIRKLYAIDDNISWIYVNASTKVHLHFALRILPQIIRFKPDLIYTRSYAAPWLYVKLGYQVISESHAHPDNRSKWFKKFVKCSHHSNFKAWITINEYLAERHFESGAANKFYVLPDAVDPDLFEARHCSLQNPFQGNGPHVTYCGHLYDYKGIPTILEAAKLVPYATFHLVGGLPQDIQRQKERVKMADLKNVIFHGLHPHSEVPRFLKYSDLLLLTPSLKHPSALWTSPVKAGEYFMSGTPVIASNIPALKRWFTNNEVEYVAPDQPQELANHISYLINDSHRKNVLARNGLLWARRNTYQIRASKILARA